MKKEIACVMVIFLMLIQIASATQYYNAKTNSDVSLDILSSISSYLSFFGSASTQQTCQEHIRVGLFGQGSNNATNCTNYTVDISAYGFFVNYQTSCPAVVNIAEWGAYYNNATNCFPKVNKAPSALYQNRSN